MIANEFNFQDTTNSLNLIMKLNPLIGQHVSSKEDVEHAVNVEIFNQFQMIATDLKLEDIVVESQHGPIYKYIGEVDCLPIIIYVSDIIGEHMITCVTVGCQTTYFNESIKNIIKRSVN